MTEITKIAATRRSDSGETTEYSTGALTADALVHTGGGSARGVIVIDDAANACTVSLHDSTDNSGPIIVPAVSEGDGFIAGVVNIDVRFNTGLYVDITTAGTVSYTVLYTAD